MGTLDTERFRRTIENRLAVLSAEIGDKLDEAARVGDDLERSADAGDQSVAEDTMSGDFADARRDVEEAQAGRAALARLDSGDYGVCVDCGREIPEARLEAMPFALRCIDCQSRRERGQGVQRVSM